MDKRTILAIVLSVVVIAGSFIIQQVFWPTKQEDNTVQQTAQPVPQNNPVATQTASTLAPANDNVVPQSVVLENNVMKVTLSNLGAVATSIKLKHHLDKGQPIEMVADGYGNNYAFETKFGGLNAPSMKEPFNVVQTNQYTYQFSKNYLDKNGVPFVFRKTFSIKPDEYIINISVDTQSSTGNVINFNGNDSYTIEYGPQMGPKYTKLDGNNEYRKFLRYNGKDRKEEGMNHEVKSFDESLKWAGISGKYFTVVGIPDGTAYKLSYSNKTNNDGKDMAILAFTRPSFKSASNTDNFLFYVGPKEESSLKKYDSESDNGFGLSGMKLTFAMEDNWLLGWLEVLLKWILLGFHYVIPNWGVSIILLTLLVKLLTWPLTQKSYKASAAMQVLQPKMKELQDKYKDDPKKLNEQMMTLYKKEGVNPMGGCLPMILQIPIFFALYGLFSNHFDLRGAMFIPGWIPDLSTADKVVDWGFNLPILNWTGLHLLPIIMVATQIWTSKLSQPSGGMNTQMKVMTFGMPLIFFFMLYEMPSGLMVYWCIQNILTVFQQSYVNKHFKKPVTTAAVTKKRGKRG